MFFRKKKQPKIRSNLELLFDNGPTAEGGGITFIEWVMGILGLAVGIVVVVLTNNLLEKLLEFLEILAQPIAWIAIVLGSSWLFLKLGSIIAYSLGRRRDW